MATNRIFVESATFLGSNVDTHSLCLWCTNDWHASIFSTKLFLLVSNSPNVTCYLRHSQENMKWNSARYMSLSPQMSFVFNETEPNRVGISSFHSNCLISILLELCSVKRGEREWERPKFNCLKWVAYLQNLFIFVLGEKKRTIPEYRIH